MTFSGVTGLRELLGKATPGPWSWTQHERGPWQIGTSVDPDDEEPIAGFVESLEDVLPVELVCESGDEAPSADAALIVAAVNALPALLDVAEAAEELKLWEPGRKGYAAAQNALFDALARLSAGEEQG